MRFFHFYPIQLGNIRFYFQIIDPRLSGVRNRFSSDSSIRRRTINIYSLDLLFVRTIGRTKHISCFTEINALMLRTLLLEGKPNVHGEAILFFSESRLTVSCVGGRIESNSFFLHSPEGCHGLILPTHIDVKSWGD